MSKFTTDYVNLIAGNLRDRYKSGFPVLKELVQNADDAGATELAFGYHPGFRGTSDHPLLRGSALWVLNNGKFKQSDARAIHSFGLSAKAADAGAIGKFGLGMKSVFHLCESFFYLAHDGEKVCRQILNPWLQDEGSSLVHQQWEQISERDFARLNDVAHAQPETQTSSGWFFLWVPLRTHEHIAMEEGRPTAAIIDYFPGENAIGGLDFLTEPGVDQRLGALLPLLRNLKVVRFGGTVERAPFHVSLELTAGSTRLDHQTDGLRMTGEVRDQRPVEERARFLARQFAAVGAEPFSSLAAAAGWPKSMAIIENGKRDQVADKASPEGAVTLGHADKRQGRLVLQWAVFLPTEERRFTYEARIPDSSRDYQIVLHGQFFVDSGRRGIEAMEVLQERFLDTDSNSVQSHVLKTWNQALAQRVILPKFLETLSEYVEHFSLKDSDARALTQAIRDCAPVGADESAQTFYRVFKPFLCKENSWVRRLGRTGASWELIRAAGSNMLPLPAPANQDHERPWRTLPALSQLKGVVFVDRDAPSLVEALDNWDDSTMARLIASVEGSTLTSQTDLEYLVRFLSMEAARGMQTGAAQDALVAMLRTRLHTAPLDDVRKNRSIFKELVALLPPDRRFGLGTRETSAKGALPNEAFRELAVCQTKALLIPGDLAPDGSPGIADESDLDEWLRSIGRVMDRMGARGDSSPDGMLMVAETLIKAAGDEHAQAALVRRNPNLRVLKALDGRDGKISAVSLEELVMKHQRQLLFRAKDAINPLGLAASLVAAIPELQVLVVWAWVAKHVQVGDYKRGLDIPFSDQASAIFKAAGSAEVGSNLGSIAARCKLLALAGSADLEDAGTVRAMRYLLHGSVENYSSRKQLWKDPSSLDSPWVRLWRMLEEFDWTVLPSVLCGGIPDNCLSKLGIQTVDERTVFNRLALVHDFSRIVPGSFSSEERNIFLGRIEDESTWQRVPFHRDHCGNYGPVSASTFLGSVPSLPADVKHALRFIEYSTDDAHRIKQEKWIARWSPETASRVVLAAPMPERNCQFLLDQLFTDGRLQTHPFSGWKSIPWLPLKGGRTISIDSLLDLEGMQADITNLARSCNFAFAGLADLADEVHRHVAFPLMKLQIASGRGALPVLGQMLCAAGMSVGRSLVGLAWRENRYFTTLSRLTSLPAWLLLAKAADSLGDEAVAMELLPEIATPLSAACVHQVLEEIQGWGNDNRTLELFHLYLKEMCSDGVTEDIRTRLSAMKLPSAAGTWQTAANLLNGVAGIAPDRIIDRRAAEILGSHIITNSDREFRPAVQREYEPWDGDTLARSVATAFEPLRDCSAQAAVGAVIGLFGNATREMASAWIGDISYDDYLAGLGWIDPGIKQGGLTTTDWMGGKTVAEAFAALKPTLEIVTGDTVTAFSILGNEVEVTLMPMSEATTLVAGAVRWKGGYAGVVPLRQPEILLDMPSARQKEILRRTAEALLVDLYNQRQAELGTLWGLFENADQVTLAIARGMILDGLPQSLRQLGSARKNSKIRLAVDQVDAARREVESARHAGGNIALHQANKERALVSLAQLVEKDVEVQAALLDGIRERVAQNQYEADSIPFELFQNADDAVSEFQQMQLADGRDEFDANLIGRFVAESRPGELRFMSWGRPVNYTGRQASYRSDYANDLERMLMLGASSKSNDEEVTGKFGLGFKSVLLVSARPRIWSGDLSFEIVAGCLPQPWIAGPDARSFQSTNQPVGTRVLRSTLVELPLDRPETSGSVTSRFAALAGVLTAFSRNIRQISVDGHQHSWKPTVLQAAASSTIELGSVLLPTSSGVLVSRLLVLRSKSGAIALRTDASGVTTFDLNAVPAVPAVWVCAPTRGTGARGVMINAQFYIDTGRGSLALGNTAARNRELVKKIADELTDVLVPLQIQSQADWAACAVSLGCTQLESAAEFWFGFWKVLFGQTPPQDAAEDAQLVECFVARLFNRVLTRVGKVPTGILGDGAIFAPIDQLNLSVKLERLGGLVPVLRDWQSFVSKLPAGGWCAEEVPDWLKRSELEKDGSMIVRLDPAVVIASFPDAKLLPDQMANLSAVIAGWPRGMLEDNAWAGLGSLMLRSMAGTWAPVRTLLHDGDAEQRLLSRFAPAGSRLDPAYQTQPDTWHVVRNYLPSFRSSTETVAGWCMSAAGHDARVGVLDFLVRNPYHAAMNLLVTYNRFSPGWISELSATHELFKQFPAEDIDLLLAKLGLVQDEDADAGAQVERPVLDLATIWNWWDAHRDTLLPKYEARLWPSRADRTLLSAEPFDRSAWMTLFSLGIFRRYGRTTDQQHRGFLDYLHGKGWWDIVCYTDPDVEPAAWMGILREYGECQMTTPLFEQWMDSFPRLYRMARSLNTYVHLFQSLDMRHETELADLLTPHDDASLSGSDIDAPTLSGMLRLGKHLVVRELLRAGMLQSEVAESLAWMPRQKVLSLMSDMGFPELETSQDIYRVLVDNLGVEQARFQGDYDIPLQLLATNEGLQFEVAAWASTVDWDDDEDDDGVGELILEENE